jgi:hypothetical protein
VVYQTYVVVVKKKLDFVDFFSYACNRCVKSLMKGQTLSNRQINSVVEFLLCKQAVVGSNPTSGSGL